MIKRLRLATGLVLFAYVATHLANHALGLISLATAEAGRDVFLFVWRNALGSTLLYGALAIHIGLALWALYVRRTLRMAPWEAVQLVMGLLIPFALVEHAIGTRLLHELHGTRDNYVYIGLALYVWQPAQGLIQAAMLLLAWVHGTIGLHFWLRLKPWHRRWAPTLLALAVLAPVLALLGFVQIGREAAAIAADAGLLRETVAGLKLPNREQAAALYAIIDGFRIGFAAAIGLTLAARIVRLQLERRRGIVRYTYPGGRLVKCTPGHTVLDVSRLSNIPHASVCGGRGRCSTCRVRVGAGAEHLVPPAPEEQKVLDRIGAPPNVRLACQIRPSRDLEVTPLLPPTATPKEAFRRQDSAHGRERVIAVLFCDLRGFTKLSEKKLPYDVVFILNRYFNATGQAVVGAGGYVDKFIGDGVMALFGLESDAETACRQAVNAARAMSAKVAELNDSLKHELAEPLRIGIGIHAGRAIIGEMGYQRAVQLTAIGDTVNTASRLEALTKDLKAELVVSEEVAVAGKIDLGAHARHETPIRGREETLAVRAVPVARELPELPIAPAKKQGAEAAAAPAPA
jgi:adenylate cyclase